MLNFTGSYGDNNLFYEGIDLQYVGHFSQHQHIAGTSRYYISSFYHTEWSGQS